MDQPTQKELKQMEIELTHELTQAISKIIYRTMGSNDAVKVYEEYSRLEWANEAIEECPSRIATILTCKFAEQQGTRFIK